jgi:hypothetical protein
MGHEEIQPEASVTPADAPAGVSESPDRRSFLKGGFTVAAAAAAGGLAASASATEPAQEAQARAAGQKLSGVVHAQFSSARPPTLEDVHAVIGNIVNRGGCPRCGLLGIDLRLSAGEPVEIESRVPVKVLVERAGAS